MAYREDVDLEFLGNLQSSDLNDLVQCLVYGTDGEKRLTEELSQSEIYKKHHPNHNKYWKEIAAEIQTFGANTFATIFRAGKGVLYREVLEDVAAKLKVKYDKTIKTDELETALLKKILGDSATQMSVHDLQTLAAEAKVSAAEGLSKEALTAVLLGALNYSPRLTLIVTNTILTSVGFQISKNVLGRSLAVLTGPIGWALTAAWTGIDIAGPAFRVTMPAVLHVALLRKMDTFKLSLNTGETD